MSDNDVVLLERFTERARRALFFARQEVSEHGGTAVGTEHLLSGVMREAAGLMRQLLTPEQFENMQRGIRELSTGQPCPAMNEGIPFTDAAVGALRAAADAATALGHHDVRAEHLLLGLLHDDTPAPPCRC
jgi:ATP-dependent Clp protease ATP-binding subunit ClpC